MSAPSKHLSNRQIAGLLKVGDAYIPGDDEFPSFSQSGFVRDADRLLDYIDERDRADLLKLMTLLGFLPRAVVRLISYLDLISSWHPLLRFLDLGMRGLINSMYYSHESTLKRIGWHTRVAGEPPQEEQPMNEGISVETVFKQARDAANDLRTMSVEARIEQIRNLRLAIVEMQDEIVDAIVKDTGKSRTDAYVSEIFATLDHLQYLEKNAARALRDEKVHTPIALMGKRSVIYYEPLGTVLVISPWNYPFAMAAVPLTSAIIAGNSVVYKPSEFTPMKGILEKLCHRARWPDSWMQVVYGDGNTGKELIAQHPDKIFFTGSVATGKKIMAQASEQLIPVELELGGKDPMIVFSDANVERAVAGALWGAFTNMGQACTSVERLYVQDAIFDDFRNRLVEKASQLVQRDDRDGSADLGRMTTKFQVAKVKEQVEDAKQKGAQVLTGANWDGQSPFIPPIILDGVTDEMLVATEETFGPVVPLIRFETESEVVAMANGTEYGLSASVWTADKNRAERVTRALVTGNVSVNNVMLTEGNAALPFGGTKQSGIGRYKGRIGLHAFSNVKSVIYDSNSNKIEANWFPYTEKKYSLFRIVTNSLFRGNLPKFVMYALKLESYSDKIGKNGRPLAQP